LGGLGSIGHGFYQSYQDFRNGDTEAGWLLLLTSSFGSIGWARQYGQDAKNIFRDILNDNRGFDANPFAGGTGSGGLDWSIVSRRTGETRVEHVQLHEVNNLLKPDHGVFYGNSVNRINDAWANKGSTSPITQGNVDLYIITSQNAGYAGGYRGQGQNLNTITIITKTGTNQIITGFPGSGYSYDLNGLLP